MYMHQFAKKLIARDKITKKNQNLCIVLQIIKKTHFDVASTWIDSDFSGGHVKKISPDFQSVHRIAKIKKFIYKITKIKKYIIKL